MAEEVTMSDPEEHLAVQAEIDSEANFKDYDDMFMAMASVAAKKSRFPNKVGAVLVKEGKIIGYGYNGTPIKSTKPDDSDVVVDAHTNAILFATAKVKGATMYSTHWPNKHGYAHIVQSAIKEIHVLGEPATEAAKLDRQILGPGGPSTPGMTKLGQVGWVPHSPKLKRFTIDFDDIVEKAMVERPVMQPDP